MSGNLKSQIANLQRKLAKLEVNGSSSNSASSNGGAKKSKSRRRRVRRSFNSSNSATYVAPALRNPNPKKISKQRGAISAGTVRIKKKELFFSVKGQDHSFKSINPFNIPWLSGMAKIFDRYKFHSIKFFWKPAVATTQAGIFMMGVDWDSNTANVTDLDKATKTIAATTPCFEVPVWQLGVFTLPSSKLMTRKEYKIPNKENPDSAYDFQPGYLLYMCSAAEGTACGHVWIEYDLSMWGTSLTE